MSREAILITRPEPGASETAGRITAMGLTPITAPMLTIVPTSTQLRSPARVAAILLASGNAVDPLSAAWHSLPVLTVGDATARRAKHAGFTDVISAGRDAASLAALVRTRFVPADGTLLLAAGRGQSLALAAELRAAGFRVTRRVVYAAEPVRHLPAEAMYGLRDTRTRAVLFFSAETARHFTRLVRAAGLVDTLRSLDAITISVAASLALREGYWARIRVAGEPTQDEMLALLHDHRSPTQ